MCIGTIAREGRYRGSDILDLGVYVLVIFTYICSPICSEVDFFNIRVKKSAERQRYSAWVRPILLRTLLECVCYCVSMP